MNYDKTDLVKIPFVLKNGNLEYYYGGDLTNILKEETFGEITVSKYNLVDADVLREIDIEEVRDFIPKNKKLYVAVNPRKSVEAKLMQFVMSINEKNQLHNYGFIEIQPLNDLKIKFRGMKQARLEECPILIPALSQVAISLNHAYHLISQAYEPGRRAHTGNVFKMTLYREENSFYYSLSDLRQKHEVEYHNRIINNRQSEENKKNSLP